MVHVARVPAGASAWAELEAALAVISEGYGARRAVTTTAALLGLGRDREPAGSAARAVTPTLARYRSQSLSSTP